MTVPVTFLEGLQKKVVGILILLQLFEALRHYEADLGFLLNVRRQIGVSDQVGDYQVFETLVVVLSLEINES